MKSKPLVCTQSLVQTLDDLRAIAMTIPRTPHPVVVT
jgi:hypothetical protein